ncbi:hypothetical protein [Nafulsella turpanensis]|uniref:hypothetical protein n=1 Tax=Nafulsella turpanensis TaxID=1265690 RepID=UPI001267C214|nr:hypothetical protein [Nafulsella turpanensis]
MVSILPLLLFISSLAAEAQQPRSFLYGGFAMNQFSGDLQADYNAYTGSFLVGVQLNRSKRLNGSFGISYGKISSENSEYRFSPDPTASPNRFFSSSLFTIQYELHVNMLKKENYILYLSQGIGLARYKPEDDLGNSLLNRYTTRAPNETYGNSSIMLPSRLGFMYLLPNAWGLGLEAGYLNTLTDYLDNIGQWGNRKGNDNVLQFSFKVYAPLKRPTATVTAKNSP